MTGDDSSSSDLSLQLANLLKNSLNQQPQNPKLSDNLQIILKLNSQNYALWTRMIRVAIGEKFKSLLSHLTTDPPDQTSEDYEQWEQEDLIVFSWLIQNIEPALAGNLTEYRTAKCCGTPWWPEQILFQFLNALGRRYEPIKREILRLEPLPSAEAAYATVRKEATHQNILGATINETQGIATGLIATETEGLWLVSKVNRRYDRSQIGSSSRVDKSKLKCEECGMTGHTKEGCFKLVGYPDWWTNGHKKGTKNSGLEKGKASIAGSTKENADTTDQKNLTGFEGMETTSVYSEEDNGLFSMNTCTGGERTYDIRTGAIIERGTEIKGLYYVDDVTQNGVVMLSHGTTELEAWLWHRRLGHPSNDYLHVLFPKGNVHEQEMVFNQEDTPSELNEHVQEREKSSTQEETSERYVLPPRANRGVPPKRYSPEKVSRGSRYPMANVAKGNLSKEAKAFVASVYFDEIPANTGQALKSKKGKKKQWKKKWKLSQKMTHGKNVSCHLERKLSGVGGFLQLNTNPMRDNLTTCLIIYVDDMIVTGDDKEEITKLKKYLFTEFEMKDLGRLKYFLGIEVLRSKQGIFMCQKRYILDLLAETGMIDCKPADTPMIANQKLYMEEKVELADKGRYQ
nr:putative Gag-polypeptide of LTR copia-type [Tanacetum cinerariifolium]